jgi:transposase
LRVVYAAPRAVAGPGAADRTAPQVAARDLRLAYAAYLLTRGFSARHAAAQCGVAPSTLGDRLRAAGNDAALLYRRMREALSADDREALDALITRGEERHDDSVGS